MSESQSSGTPLPAAAEQSIRTTAIIVYALYLAAVISCGIAGIIGVIIAYVKRDDARGTLWESHFENQIHAFWTWFVLAAIGVFTIWMVIGFAIIAVAFIWFLYRTIKGLLRALDSKPYV